MSSIGLHHLFAKHRLCVLPKALERTVTERSDDQNHLLLHVALRVSFTLTSVEDGSAHEVEAMARPWMAETRRLRKPCPQHTKPAMVQTFCIPVANAEDPDRTSHRLTPRTHSPEPLQGWRQWCLDIEDIVSLCESEQAISTVQQRNRDLLKALAREQPQLYAELGQAFVSRREVLAARSSPPRVKRSRAGQSVKAKAAEVEHA